MQKEREGAEPGWAGWYDAKMCAGMVYAMTNVAAGNEVIAFRRADDGTLTRLNAYPTCGRGTGTRKVSPATPQNGIDPLTSQGSLSFSRNGCFLFAVNAGSDSITSFRVADDGMLVLADVVHSGGFQPNSLNEYGNLLYVSNVGNAANGYTSNITGFRVANDGRLEMIPGSARMLSTPNAQPACVVFSPCGGLLSVLRIDHRPDRHFRRLYGRPPGGTDRQPLLWRVAVRRLLPFHREPAGDGDIRRAVILYRRRGWTLSRAKRLGPERPDVDLLGRTHAG